MDILPLTHFAPFWAALAISGAFLGIELLLLLVGASLQGDFDFDSDSGAAVLLDWILVKNVPLIVLLAIYLSSFAIVGASLQYFYNLIFSGYLNTLLVSLISLLPAWVGARLVGKAISPLFNGFSSAMSVNSFVGLSGPVTTIDIKKGDRGEVKIIDKYGQSHYINAVCQYSDLKVMDSVVVKEFDSSSNTFYVVKLD